MKAVALKLVLRSWWRNKTFSIISIVSLAIGIACTNLLAAFVIYEFNIEADNPNKEKIVYMAQDSPMKSGEKVSFIVGEIPIQLKEQYTEVEDYLRFSSIDCNSVTIGNKKYDPILITSTDTTFARFFEYEVLYGNLHDALSAPDRLKLEAARSIREDEERCDHYEDIIGTYLVQLSSHSLSDSESQESTELLKTIGDFERISDHAVNVLESAEELQSKGLSFSPAAMAEYETLARAIREILHLSLDGFRQNDAARAARVEPLEQVIDKLKEEMRTRHILRMRQGQCSIEAGFVWADLLTDLERTSDHCSNIAGCVIDAARHNLNLHETLRAAQTQDPDFAGRFRDYAQTYRLPEGE